MLLFSFKLYSCPHLTFSLLSSLSPTTTKNALVPEGFLKPQSQCCCFPADRWDEVRMTRVAGHPKLDLIGCQEGFRKVKLAGVSKTPKARSTSACVRLSPGSWNKPSGFQFPSAVILGVHKHCLSSAGHLVLCDPSPWGRQCGLLWPMEGERKSSGSFPGSCCKSQVQLASWEPHLKVEPSIQESEFLRLW